MSWMAHQPVAWTAPPIIMVRQPNGTWDIVEMDSRQEDGGHIVFGRSLHRGLTEATAITLAKTIGTPSPTITTGGRQPWSGDCVPDVRGRCTVDRADHCHDVTHDHSRDTEP